MAPVLAQATWGVMMTFGKWAILNKGLFDEGGSFDKQSIPSARIWPVSMALTASASLTMPPLAVLIKMGCRFIFANSLAVIKSRV